MANLQLHEVIHENAERIVDVFVRKSRRHELPPREAELSEVVDDLNRFVRELARACRLGADERAAQVAKAHGGQRWYAGYELKSVLLEYGVLRTAIAETVHSAGYQMSAGEVERIAELINTSLAEAAVEFTMQATAQIKAALETADAAARAREDIVAVVSHDLKNPLNVIHGSLTLLTDSIEQEDLQSARVAMRQTVARMRRASLRMQRLISDLLDLAQIREGRVELELTKEPTSELIREAIEQSTPLAELRPAHLLDEGGAVGSVNCDRERVLQVFDNIVGNAIKFCPVGATVRLRVEHTSEESLFVVRDDGPGIAAAQLPRLFDRFWTGGGADVSSGTGLGLAIAKGIVDAHGGRIWVESTLGEGTSFFFTLPNAASV
ncbi:MAG TPA: HAMP domain-containing sensor histidine kinase [Polyangiaceae bacterium]|nr:HAMP domain-containing sensor histidine kinase [Polyangiaceae bacterium]